MRSSTTPPEASSQQSVYCACPTPMRRRSLVSRSLTKSTAPAPRTTPLPRWLTSKTPTASRTARCSLSTPPPGYSIGISQPPKSASLAPRATWRSCSGPCWRSVTPRNLLRALPQALGEGPQVVLRHPGGSGYPQHRPVEVVAAAGRDGARDEAVLQQARAGGDGVAADERRDAGRLVDRLAHRPGLDL